MKKLFLLVFFMAFMSLGSAEAQMVLPQAYPGLLVEISPISTKPVIRPRSIVIDDIEAYYSNESITLMFNKDLGDADIVVTNLTTGDIWNDSVSGVCSTTIILSGDEGYYQIAIYTDNGDYSGEFTL